MASRSDNILRPCKGYIRTRAIYKAIYRQHLWRDSAAMGSSEITKLSLPGVAVFDLLRPRGLDLLEEQAMAIEKLAVTEDLPGSISRCRCEQLIDNIRKRGLAERPGKADRAARQDSARRRYR